MNTQSAVPERLNASVRFVSEDMAVIGDGAGRFHLYCTGDRSTSHQWKVSHYIWLDTFNDKFSPIINTFKCISFEDDFIVETWKSFKLRFVGSFLTDLHCVSSEQFMHFVILFFLKIFGLIEGTDMCFISTVYKYSRSLCRFYFLIVLWRTAHRFYW